MFENLVVKTLSTIASNLVLFTKNKFMYNTNVIKTQLYLLTC